MIIKLDNSNENVATQIFEVFQKSYKIEAELVGIENFPPLLRKKSAIQKSQTQFYGFIDKKQIAAVIELVIDNTQLEIWSLTVAPTDFRKGLASKLLSFAFNSFNCNKVMVETAVENTPAINLYKKHGFVETKRWKTKEGINKLAMLVNIVS